MGNILSANHSSVMVDGEAINELQAISFKTNVSTEEIYAIGKDERIDVSFGKKAVSGSLVIKSYCAKLDNLLQEKSKFQIVAKLKKQKGLTEGERTISLDEVFLEGKDFEMSANGVAQLTYHFTATRIRDE